MSSDIRVTPHQDLSGKWFVTFKDGRYTNRGIVLECLDDIESIYLVQFYSAYDLVETTQEKIALADMQIFAFYSNYEDWLNQCAWGTQTQMAAFRRTL